jgi:2-dehydro-3-deoxyphosphogluconate aldolase / (4S)-4-hydroxy-2-oxoglutarate aldolase
VSARAVGGDLTTERLLELDPVIPVVVLEDVAHAVPLAQALLAGGLRTIEVTLRTPAALPAIARIAAELPELVVGAGTIASESHVEAARSAGARFLVSPGATPQLLDALASSALPFLAGVATPSDVLALLERGIACAKLFPASAAGGIAMAKALAGPFPDVRLCPTGGIDADSAPAWLALPNVACVGGTWLARGPLSDAHDLRRVTTLARAASALRATAR